MLLDFSRFEDSLNKVRIDAGLSELPKSSFLQRGLNFMSMAVRVTSSMDGGRLRLT